MPANRFFYEGSLSEGDTVMLEGDEAKHITKVMRHTHGDTLEIFNGRGVLAHGSILSTEKRAVQVQIAQVETATHPATEIHLWQAFIRPSKLDLIMEKGTELGIAHFHLYQGEYSDKTTLSEHQMRRLNQLVMSGCKQSGRLFLPKIHSERSLLDAPSGLFGDISPAAPHILSVPHSRVIHFINGPESGFSKNELKHFEKNQFQGVSLSDAVLRTETAAIAAATLLNSMR